MTRSPLIALGVLGLAVIACSSRRPIEEIERDIYAADPIERQGLVVELRGHGVAAVPAWIEMFDNEAKNLSLHVVAAAELYDLGPDAAQAVPTLVEVLREGFFGREMDPHPDVIERFEHEDKGRKHAREVLKAIGAASVGAVRGVLADSRDRSRQEAAVTLGQIGGDASVAMGDLVGMLNDEDKAVVAAAMWALGEIGAVAEVESTVLTGLVTALGDESWVVRLEAIKALGKFNTKAVPVRGEVMKLVDDPVVEVANHAVHALELIKAPE